jgi:hypothetical protein
LAVVIALVSSPLLTPGMPVLLAALAALIVGFWPGGQSQRNEQRRGKQDAAGALGGDP